LGRPSEGRAGGRSTREASPLASFCRASDATARSRDVVAFSGFGSASFGSEFSPFASAGLPFSAGFAEAVSTG
jgi:hypothetical protein